MISRLSLQKKVIYAQSIEISDVRILLVHVALVFEAFNESIWLRKHILLQTYRLWFISQRPNLKVPSHQIRSAWKSFCWIGLDMYMDRGWLQDFSIWPSFIYLKWSSPSGILPTCSALHAIRGYRRQMGLKGNRLPFATAPQVIWALLATWQRVMKHRMQIQSHLHAVLN